MASICSPYFIEAKNHMTTMVCNKCGHAHFRRTEDEVTVEANNFKRYFDGLSDEDRQKYYGGRGYEVADAIEQQKKCFRCGGPNTEFHEETPEDRIPAGVTLQGIIIPE
jgi:predicted nucleic-acid-binding Zn-ribbon protein